MRRNGTPPNHDPLLDQALSLSARGLYQILNRHWADDPDRLCRVSQDELATEAGVSQRSIQRYLRELIAGRYIEVQPGPARTRCYLPLD